MVLGIILYEGVDLAYNVARIGYNGVTGVYNWWYQVQKKQHQETSELITEIKNLNNRIKELENNLPNKTN
jgi:hypothetical protein